MEVDPPGRPAGLRLTIRCGKPVRSVQARPAGPILPPCRLCQNMQQDPASSHVLKTYSGLVFTVLRRDVMRNRRAHPPAPPTPPEEPPCLHRGSLRPRPQALETLCSGLQLRESCQGKCLSFRSQTVSCIVQTHSVNNDLTLESEPRLSGPLSPGFLRWVWRENRRGIGFPHPDPVFLLLWDYG